MPIVLDGTTGIAPATWTTAGRPTSPTNGQMGFNTTTGLPEWYDSAEDQWFPFSVTPTYSVEYLVIAGGGSGGYNYGAGAGAGGYRCSVAGENSGGGGSAEPTLLVSPDSYYTIVVGAGGAGIASAGIGLPGANSSISTSGATLIESIGGGGGGRGYAGPAGSGGSGGGTGPGALPGSGTLNQGFAGGFAGGTSAGGGGGAGAVGNDGVGATSGIGGAGQSSSINGSATFRAGGGSGGGQSTGSVGGGGAAIGSFAQPGAVNTGSGGAGFSGSGTSGAGGSGLVIIRYAGDQRGTGGTVTSAGGFTIHTFTSSGTYTA